MNTIDAMKQILNDLLSMSSTEACACGCPTNEKASLMKPAHAWVMAKDLAEKLDALISREEAQAGEPPTVISEWLDGMCITLICDDCNTLPNGRHELFTRPAPPASGEREELIATYAKLAASELRASQLEQQFNSQCRITASALNERADMLAADAQEITQKGSHLFDVLTERDALQAEINDLKAQQAAVPHGFDPVYVSRLIEALYENSDPVSVDAAEEFQRMLTAAPQPPQTDAPQVEASPMASCGRDGGCDCGVPHVCCDHYIEPDVAQILAVAQEVAVPQAMLRAATEYSAQCHTAGQIPSGMGYYKAMLSAAPQPPQADAQPQRQPMTDDEIDNILAESTKNVPCSWRKMARSIEAHHGIGVKP